MTSETRAAFAAALAADTVIHFAQRARDYHEIMPDDWALIDQAYWLCHEAVETCQRAADRLDPEVAEEDACMLMAFQSAMGTLERVQEAADDLVTLATESEHEIRR